uniref:Uncharacterized protein n=1 Tax=Plectus sambesii TaxID=2011161 RepID=A0A914VUM2_9BILA
MWSSVVLLELPAIRKTEVLIDGSSALSIPTRCIGVQCLPTPQDGASHGLCLTLLCMEKPRMNSKPSRPERYHWAPVDDPVTAHLLTALESQGPVFHLS